MLAVDRSMDSKEVFLNWNVVKGEEIMMITSSMFATTEVMILKGW
jgi:hypothetical protein